MSMFLLQRGSPMDYITGEEKKKLLRKAKVTAGKTGLNEERLYDMYYCDYILRHFVRSEGDVKIDSTIGKFFPGAGTIEVNGKDLKFDIPAAFVSVMRKASNMEVTPLSDGSVEIDFMFYGMTGSEVKTV